MFNSNCNTFRMVAIIAGCFTIFNTSNAFANPSPTPSASPMELCGGQPLPPEDRAKIGTIVTETPRGCKDYVVTGFYCKNNEWWPSLAVKNVGSSGSSCTVSLSDFNSQTYTYAGTCDGAGTCNPKPCDSFTMPDCATPTAKGRVLADGRCLLQPSEFYPVGTGCQTDKNMPGHCNSKGDCEPEYGCKSGTQATTPCTMFDGNVGSCCPGWNLDGSNTPGSTLSCRPSETRGPSFVPTEPNANQCLEFFASGGCIFGYVSRANGSICYINGQLGKCGGGKCAPNGQNTTNPGGGQIKG